MILGASVAIREGRSLFSKHHYRSAASRFRTAAKLLGRHPSAREAIKGLKSIQERGMGEMAEAQRLYDAGQFAEARALAEKTKNRFGNVFGGMDCESKYMRIPELCADLIDKIDGSPEIQDGIREAEAARLVGRLDSLERRAIRDNRVYCDYYRALEKIARRYPDCPSGRRCAARILQLQKDTRLHRLITEESDRRVIHAALQMLDYYRTAGDEEAAESELRALKRKFPGFSLAALRKRAR